MSRVKVQLADNIKRVIRLDPDATNGATFGVNFFLSNGVLATPASLAAFLGVGSALNAGVTDHRLLAGLPIGNDHPQYTRKDTLTTRGDIYYRDAATIARLAKGSDRQFLRANATDPAWETVSTVLTLGTDLSGSVTFTNLANGTLNATIVGNAVTDAKLRDSTALSVIGRASNSSGDPADIVAASDGQTLRRNGTAIGFGALDLSNANAISGDLPFANLTQGSARSVLAVVGAATADFASLAAAADDTVLSRTAGSLSFGQLTVGMFPAAVVTYAKIQNVSATNRVLGRITAGAGVAEELTPNNLNTILSAATSAFTPAAPPVLPNFVVASLPSAVTSGSGALAFVTDATLTAITGLGLPPIGGGANKVPVYSDGTNWLIL